MRAIRSLLWIGPGKGLADSGVAEAPTLDVTWVSDAEQALALPPIAFDGAVLEGTSPAELARQMQRLRRRAHCPPILACLPDADAAAIRHLLGRGADEVVVQSQAEGSPPLLDELLERLDHLARRRRDGREEAPPPSGEDGGGLPGGLIARSRPMRDVYALVERAGRSRATVLLTGETGSGKERIARQIHQGGVRARGPFIALNCAAFPESLLESELFGHRRGSFTGAERDKAGHFELAHRGTLFLDEIAETGAALQAKLLRVLQEREVLPVGASRPHPIDVQVIAATNRSLVAEVKASRFREDLYYRLAVFPIQLPSLCDRREDILPLANHFLQLHGKRDQKPGCRLSAASAQLLQAYSWPGNVRELENEMQRALALAEPLQLITPKLLTPRLLGLVEAIDQAPRGAETLHQSLQSIEAWLIRRALEHNGGRRAVTARKLGVTREGLYKKMKRYGIE